MFPWVSSVILHPLKSRGASIIPLQILHGLDVSMTKVPISHLSPTKRGSSVTLAIISWIDPSFRFIMISFGSPVTVCTPMVINSRSPMTVTHCRPASVTPYGNLNNIHILPLGVRCHSRDVRTHIGRLIEPIFIYAPLMSTTPRRMG